MKKNLAFLLLINIFSSVYSQEEDDYYFYGCENCFLTSFIPFGEFKVGVYLNPNDANNSSLVLYNKNNLVIDTLKGHLAGFLGIVKTGQRSFVSYGYDTSVRFIISENKILIDKAIGTRWSNKFKIDKMTISHPTIAIDDYLFGLFYNNLKKSNDFNSMAIGYLNIKNNPTYIDKISSSEFFYGGRTPLDKNYLISGKSKEAKFLKIFELKDLNKSNRNNYLNYTYLEGIYYYLGGFNNEIFKINAQNDKEPSVSRFKLNIDQKKYEIKKILADLYRNELIAFMKNKDTDQIEGWKIIPNSGKYTREFKTNYIPYFIEDGKMFIFIEDEKSKNILRIPY
jgi:hypothetical protein